LGLMFLVPAATGLFVAHRFQTNHRIAFARLLEAEAANARLEREIEARKELEAELKRQAATDSLTGLNNRRRYEALFRHEFRRTKRYGGRLSLFVLDLDHFKQVNDNYGHSAGDTALQKLADLCRSSLREPDIIGRLGGEEFVVLLPDTGGSDAYNVADRLRKKISETEIKTDHGRFTLTATIGVAEASPDDKEIEDLVRRADTALYKGKAYGRNRVSIQDFRDG
ncbi:MAG: GGDEF domain-containing protein, partial [Desulfobacterales bacterium]|nr:GGDEF domain-containing protein [Desulfobacterales bacterium]